MKLLILSLFLSFSCLFGSFEYLEDRDSNLTINDVQKVKFLTKNGSNFDRKRYPLWFKIEFENNQSIDTTKFLKFNFPLLDRVEFYQISNNNLIKHSINGTVLDIKNREFDSYDLVFKIVLPKNSVNQIYFKIQTKSAMLLLYTIYSNIEELYQNIEISNILFGILFGISITLIVYNLSIYFYLKDKIYFIYVLYVFVFFIYQLFYTGVIQKFIYIENYIFWIWIVINIYNLFGFLFIVQILNLQKNRYLILYFIFESILGFTLVFIDLYIEAFLGYIFTFFNLLLIFAYSLRAIFNGNNLAKVFLIAWGFFFVGLVLNSLTFNGKIEVTLFSIYAMQIASVIEMLLFSIILGYRIYLLKNENRKVMNLVKNKDELLQFQSKFVTIGETLCNIEHQWRSPLTQIGSKICELEAHLHFKGVPNREYLDNFSEDINNLLTYMSQTIDDFKRFYIQDSNQSEFFIRDSIVTAVKLMNYYIKINKIDLSIEYESKDIKVFGYQNEFTQVILNLLSNAKDAFIERNITNRKIEIVTKKLNNTKIIEVVDNAGGIEEKIVNRIFDPFFSEKSFKSSGLGLYMSKTIIEDRMRGKLDVLILNSGTLFRITLN